MSSPVEQAIDMIRTELTFARKKFDKFNSAHEGYAVILEELDELWDQVKKRPELRNSYELRKEATQVAAMSLAFMLECCQ